MKFRNGFVSNSSSSSFLIVGVDNYQDPRLAILAKADEWREGFGGYNKGKTLVFLGNNYYMNDYGDKEKYEPYYVGIEVEQDLRSGKTVSELKKVFIAKVKALGVIFSEDEVDLHYGEISSE